MTITSEMVRDLREKTGCGMMDCKRALTETSGDMEKAVDALRKKGLATAAKKAERVATQGVVVSYLDMKSGIGVLLEVNCETDFVAKNPDFQKFAKDIIAHIAKNKPADISALLNQNFASDPGKTVSDAIKEMIAKFGENILIGRFSVFETSKGLMECYIHLNGKIGVLVELESDKEINDDVKILAKDISLQIAASRPSVIAKEEVPSETLMHERDILKAQALTEGKPEKIIDKMVEGRLGKFYSEFCLMEQPFIKDPAKKIADIVKETSSKTGGKIFVKKFTRYQIGEKS
ncbi:MAG: translation elongation factor Ts [Candidatus Margulisiibacteriota bacterium]